MPATNFITGGESHAQLRCLRRPTGPARTHTPHGYVKTLYRIAGQNYCRNQIIKVAVAAGVIVEIKPPAGSGTVRRGGAASGDQSRS